MLVYRLEDKNGNGPLAGGWRATVDIRHLIQYHQEPAELARSGKSSHPYTTINDLMFNGSNRFAWQTLENMAQFAKFPRQVDNAGYAIVVYDVADDKLITFHDGQAMFSINDANAVGGFPFSRCLKVLFNHD